MKFFPGEGRKESLRSIIIIINFQTLLYALQTILLFRPYTRKFRGRNTLEIEADCWQDSLCSRDARYICTQWASCEAHCFRKHARNTNTKAARLFEIYVYTDSLLPVSLSRKFNICLIIPHFSSSFSLFPSNFNSSSFSPAKISSEIFLHELSRHFHPFSRAE